MSMMSLLSGNRNILRSINLSLQGRWQHLCKETRKISHASDAGPVATESTKQTKKKRRKPFAEVIEVTDGSAKQRNTKLKKYDISAFWLEPLPSPNAKLDQDVTDLTLANLHAPALQDIVPNIQSNTEVLSSTGQKKASSAKRKNKKVVKLKENEIKFANTELLLDEHPVSDPGLVPEKSEKASSAKRKNKKVVKLKENEMKFANTELMLDEHPVSDPGLVPEKSEEVAPFKKYNKIKLTADRSKEREILRKKRLAKSRRDYFLAVMDVYTDHKDHALAAISYFRSFRRREDLLEAVTEAAEITELYNGVLRCVSKKGDVELVKTVLAMMKSDRGEPNARTFAYCFETIGRQRRTMPDSVLADTSATLMTDLATKGLGLQSLFQKRTFENNEREMTIKGIRLHKPDFFPSYDPVDTRYHCSLVNILNDKDTSGVAESPIAGVVDGKTAERLVADQVAVEFDGSLTIKSIAKDDDLDDSAAAKETLNGYETFWEASISKVLERQIRILKKMHSKFEQKKLSVKNQDWVLYPFLSALPISDLSNLVLQQVRHLLSCSNSFSPPLFSLEYDLGDRFYRRFIQNRRKNTKLDEKMRRLHQIYINRLLEPQVGKISTPRDIWEQIEFGNLKGPDVGAEVVLWPDWLTQQIGEYLFKVIIDDVKFDARRQTNKPSDLVPAFYIVYRLKGVKYFRELKVHPLLAKLHADSASRDLTFDFADVPMVAPPKPWMTHATGGFLTSESAFLRSENGLRTDRLVKSPPEKLFPVLDSLNGLGVVPWKINTPILDLIIDVFNNKGNEDLGIPLHPSTVKPPPGNFEDMAPTDKPLFYRDLALYRKRKAELMSLWCSGLFALSLANHFREKAFWFPQNMDFRGRVYPMPPHLNHLQSDYGRALLVFAKGRPLGANGLRWLKLHAINLTGNMKRKSVAERLEHVDTILDELVDCAQNPLKGTKWWQNSDDPWQTLACCMEIEKALTSPDPEKYICHLPIHQDGSCNGLQHYAALGRDMIGARSVNLAAGDIPGDVYSDVATLVERQRSSDAEKGNEVAKALQGFVTRKVIKQTVMTIVYGVTRYGARLQILRQLKDMDEFPRDHASQASVYLTAKTFDCIREMFTSAREIQDWFNDCARVISNDCGKHIEWVTPLGLPVVQTYSKDPRNEWPNAVKQKNAFAPNFVHSLDSCHMMMTSLFTQREGMTFASVHDCFWTHPCSVDTMSTICRDSFVALHSEPILENLSSYFQSTYERPLRRLVELGRDPKSLEVFAQVPERGDFDLNEVKNSIYFFS